MWGSGESDMLACSGPAYALAIEKHTPTEVSGFSIAFPSSPRGERTHDSSGNRASPVRHERGNDSPPRLLWIASPLAIGPCPCVMSTTSWIASPLAIGPRPCVMSTTRGLSQGWLVSSGLVFLAQVSSTWPEKQTALRCCFVRSFQSSMLRRRGSRDAAGRLRGDSASGVTNSC